MVTDQPNDISPQYLYQNANHTACLENNRRNSNHENAADILGNALAHGVSRVCKGCWQQPNAA